LFENIVESSLENLQTIIQNDIAFYFPQIVVREIDFVNTPDENTINFILTYEIINFGIEDNINILLQ
jgi:hypothetical protein